jgi:hypothetical protein
MPNSLQDWNKSLGKVHTPIGDLELPTTKQVAVAVAVGIVAIVLIKIITAIVVTALLAGTLYVAAHDAVILIKAEYQFQKDKESFFSFIDDGSTKASQALEKTYVAKYIALLL